MAAYYNEFDPYAAQWLRNLIAADHIAPGDVDERSLLEVAPDDLKGYAQCHFFAGIGVWSHALRQAGWANDRPIWTGSCPCQPFSAAGKQKGFDDERHLWPIWFRLIDECRPPIVLGEQVASALDWLDLVSADMEGAGYAIGASDLCAAGFGGAHIRQRLYFVGVGNAKAGGWAGEPLRTDRDPTFGEPQVGDAGRLADDDAGSQGRDGVPECAGERAAGPSGVVGGLADTCEQRCDQQHSLLWPEASGWGAATLQQVAGGCLAGDTHAPMLGRDAADWLYCRDGKWRPVEPGTFPLADAPPARVGRLRAYGNALDAETATQFCGAVKDIIDLTETIDTSIF